jgi:hypothetical protein
VLCVGGKKENTCVPMKKNILQQASNILPTTTPFYAVNAEVSTTLKIFYV